MVPTLQHHSQPRASTNRRPSEEASSCQASEWGRSPRGSQRAKSSLGLRCYECAVAGVRQRKVTATDQDAAHSQPDDEIVLADVSLCSPEPEEERRVVAVLELCDARGVELGVLVDGDQTGPRVGEGERNAGAARITVSAQQSPSSLAPRTLTCYCRHCSRRRSYQRSSTCC